jgi:lipopolysaccharide/colanic/teichoic acid biosynthesis glycosyltransferase
MNETQTTEEKLDRRQARGYSCSSWCNSVWKRAFDITFAGILLCVLLPLLIMLALVVKMTSKGDILFRQRRPGRAGREFNIMKFRTMVTNEKSPGPVLTRAEDPRVTWIGRHLRKWKLDELPQLVNVFRGDMTFVGPRPQPTKLWKDTSIQEQASCVLSVRPGITSHATLNYRNEEELLAPLTSTEVEDVYLKTIMPVKLEMELEYLRRANFRSDISIICNTVFRIVHRREHENQLLRKPILSSAEQKSFRSVAGNSD